MRRPRQALRHDHPPLRERIAFYRTTTLRQAEKYSRTLRRYLNINQERSMEDALADYNSLVAFINGENRRNWTKASLARDLIETLRQVDRQNPQRTFPIQELRGYYKTLQTAAKKDRVTNTEPNLRQKGKYLLWNEVTSIAASSLLQWVEEQRTDLSLIRTALLTLLTSIPPLPGTNLSLITIAASLREYAAQKNSIFFDGERWRIKITPRRKGLYQRPSETILQTDTHVYTLLAQFTSKTTRNALNYPSRSNRLFVRRDGREYVEGEPTSAVSWTIRIQTVIRAAAVKSGILPIEESKKLRISTEALRRSFCTYVNTLQLADGQQIQIQRSMALSRRALESTYNLRPQTSTVLRRMASTFDEDIDEYRDFAASLREFKTK